MGRRISNSKEQFYYSLSENERIKEMEIFNVLKEKYMDFYNVCEKFADISLNAPKYRVPGTCDVQGYFQFKDIERAKRSAKAFFADNSLKNVDEYMLGTFAQEDISYALHKISTGTKFYDRELLYRLVEDEPAATITSKNNLGTPLTRRELEILSQLSNGLSNFEIAKNLNISENTVKKHISNIFIKINVKDRTQAIIYAYESGLIAKPLFL